MIIKIEGKCQYEGCDKDATVIASGRRAYNLHKDEYHPPGCYCEDHGAMVVSEGNPEYDDECPNCGCIFGCN